MRMRACITGTFAPSIFPLKHSVFKSFSCSCSSSSSASLSNAAAAHPGIAKVVLKKGKAKMFDDGHPMVYSGAVEKIMGRYPPKAGDAVLVTDALEQPFAWGLYNPASMFIVRLMQMENDASRDPMCILNMENLLKMRIVSAVDLRKRLGLPRSDTNAYRLVNSEGDRLSGLTVDVFNNHAVIASSAAWVERYRSVIELLIKDIPGISHIMWWPSVQMLKAEGMDIELGDIKLAPINDKIKIKENGVIYSLSLEGQKTGFYTDQRDNRSLVGSLSEGRRVLDLCCYTGGFSLNAALKGASHVTGVDSSAPALELAEENIKLNNFNPKTISFVKGDISKFMKAAALEQQSWDLIILDPPKLAPNRKVLERASRTYFNYNALAMQLSNKGGLLLTCSCSAAMTQSGSFLGVLQKAAHSVGRKITLIHQTGAAADHPVDPSYPESTYFTSILLRIF